MGAVLGEQVDLGIRSPPFPLLQPGKVLSLPLLLRFDEGYRYRLDGTARVDDYDCYVVRFEPLKADASLYTGTIWIDRRPFSRIRVQAVQGGLAAPVVSWVASGVSASTLACSAAPSSWN